MKKTLDIALVGGGSSAHVLIPILSRAGHRISLLSSRPEQWGRDIKMEVRNSNNVPIREEHGTLSAVSDDPAEVIPNRDIILLCMPVHQYRKALQRIAPYLDRNAPVCVGCIYGQAGVNWMMREVIREYGLQNMTYFSFGLLPWICRTLEYGHSGINYGPKKVNVAAVFPRERFAWLNENFLSDVCFNYFGCGEVREAENFLSLTLSVDNQIIHPCRCYGLQKVYGGRWKEQDDVPYFYRDFDDTSADIMRVIDNEYSEIRRGIIRKYPEMNFQFMLNYLDLEHLSYQSCNKNIKESFVMSETLRQIKLPVVLQNGYWRFDVTHRFFTDDINYGLCIAKWFGDQLGIATPMIDEILLWAKAIREESYCVEGKLQISETDLQTFKYGIPPSYGIESLAAAVQ